MDQTLIPVTPAPPSSCTRKPPTKAPAMPISAVTISPRGPRPGITSLASRPAINPTTINARMPMPNSFALGLLHPYAPRIRRRGKVCCEGGPAGGYGSWWGGEETPLLAVSRTGGSSDELRPDRRAESLARPGARLRPERHPAPRRPARPRAEVPLRHSRRDGGAGAHGPHPARGVRRVGGRLPPPPIWAPGGKTPPP